MSADDASTLPDLVAGRLSTAVVSDILDDPGHRDVLDPAIRPLGDAPAVHPGRAWVRVWVLPARRAPRNYRY